MDIARRNLTMAEYLATKFYERWQGNLAMLQAFASRLAKIGG